VARRARIARLVPGAFGHGINASGLLLAERRRTKRSCPSGAVAVLRKSIVSLLLATWLLAGTAMAAEGTLWVRVVGEDRARLPGACFQVYRDAGGGQLGDYIGAYCDEDDGLMDGTVIIGAEAANYVLTQSRTAPGYDSAGPQQVTIVADQATAMEITNHPTGESSAPPTETAATPSPPPSSADIDQVFEVEGQPLHLVCQGNGEPTVVLEAGGPGFDSTWWSGLQPQIAKITRTCAYDRAFLGSSEREPPAEPRTIDQSVHELHDLLVVAGIACPCVFVGASWGGPIIQLYADQDYYAGDVAGLVFVDGVPPGFVDQFVNVTANASGLAQLERDRLLGTNNPEHVDQEASLRMADAAEPPPGGVPAAVIEHGGKLGFDVSLPVEDLEKHWHDDQVAFAEKYNARFYTAAKSGSDPVHEQPDIVIAAISYVVEVARDPAKRLGSIRVISVATTDKSALAGACYEIYVDSGDDSVNSDEFIDGMCDGDARDQVVDGAVRFEVEAGRYVVVNTQPPPGYTETTNRAVRVTPEDTTEVLIEY
jgi:pimeloyl-ACP methyl ester carboxylesterase